MYDLLKLTTVLPAIWPNSITTSFKDSKRCARTGERSSRLNAPAESHCPVQPPAPGRTHKKNRDRPPVAMSSLLKVSLIERP